MDRIALKHLEKWKSNPRRKPLLLRGARQVGKTWLVRELGKTYKNFVEFNLEAETDLHPHFAAAYGKPDTLIRLLEIHTKKKIDLPSTLLFIDEIQECSEAILALRYFKEKRPDLHVIGAGSLLEFAFKELSFPVGRIETMHIFPLAFAEYLAAQGRLSERRKLLKIQNVAEKDALHTSFLQDLRIYMLIGGMPEVVATYLETEDFAAAQSVQQQLVTNFRLDFNKYASRAKIPFVRRVFDESARLLGKKYIYAHVAADIKARELGAAVSLQEKAGILHRVCHSSGNGVPLSAEAATNKFKLFYVDIGMANRILGLNLNEQLYLNPDRIINRGGMAEQFVAQELLKLTPMNTLPSLHYWHREEKSAQAEVDFLLEQNNRVIPIEVKSGDKHKFKSLAIFMNEKKSTTGACLSTSVFDLKQPVKKIPLYMVDEVLELI